MKKIRVGFIGLGLMGNPMAHNILKRGYPLFVYNRTIEKTKEFKSLGATVCNSPTLLAKECDVIISMITGPEDVKQVHLGKNGTINSAHPNLVVVDMSTIGPSAAREVGLELKKKGVQFLDAPVTGSTDKAIFGELSIFVGGEREVLEKVRGVLEAMGTNIVYMGENGFGQAQKLVNNLLVGLTTEALAEAFLLGERLGLKREKVADALQNVFAVSPSMKVKFPNIISNTFPTAFSVANIRKDLKLAIEEFGKKQNNLPSLALVERLYKKAMDMGYSKEDLSAVIKVLNKS